jgi:hypothetical protein
MRGSWAIDDGTVYVSGSEGDIRSYPKSGQRHHCGYVDPPTVTGSTGLWVGFGLSQDMREMVLVAFERLLEDVEHQGAYTFDELGFVDPEVF